MAPLRYGSGIKGKIIESIYQGVPVITTTCGAEGIDNKNKMLTIADDGEKFAEEILSKYSDRTILNIMSAKGKAFVTEYYSIESAVKKIRELF